MKPTNSGEAKETNDSLRLKGSKVLGGGSNTSQDPLARQKTAVATTHGSDSVVTGLKPSPRSGPQPAQESVALAAPAKGQRFQSFRTNPPDRSLDASSSGSYNDEQRDSISNLQDDQNLIYKGTSFDQIFRQSFIRSHSRTAGLRKSRKMSADVLSADDSPPSPSTRLRAGSDSSLQPSMNPGSFGNAITPARAVIQEESKESSGEEAEDRKRGLQLVSAN